MRASLFVTLGLTCVLGFVTPKTIGAQRANRPAAELQSRLLERFLDHATAELDLTDEQRSNLSRLMRETLDRRRALAREGIRLRREARGALAEPETPGERFRQLMDASMDLRRRELELLAWQKERLLENLSPRQTLRFLHLQERLARRIEQLRRERR